MQNYHHRMAIRGFIRRLAGADARYDLWVILWLFFLVSVAGILADYVAEFLAEPVPLKPQIGKAHYQLGD